MSTYPQFGYSYPSAASALTAASSQLLMPTVSTLSTTVSGSTLSSSSAPTTSCCESGRPIMTDPHTGQTICSCQYNPSLLSYPRISLGDTSVYSSAIAAQGYMPFGADPSAFYSPLNGYDLKDGSASATADAWRSLSQPMAGYPYDPTGMAGYPYGNSYGGMDLNAGARRKNATRETTSTLKAWLYEHRKNPYPTKGEKIMLAIITKMTLTQVSTWFANARRRLKKENKMTWSPRNRCGDGRDKDSDDDDDDMDDAKDDNNNAGSDDEDTKLNDEIKLGGDVDKDVRKDSRLPDLSTSTASTTVTNLQNNTNGDSAPKPRIWSLADVATSTTPSSGRRSPSLSTSTIPPKAEHFNSPMNSLRQWVDGAYTTSQSSQSSHPSFSHPYLFSSNPSAMGLPSTSLASSNGNHGNSVDTPPSTPPTGSRTGLMGLGSLGYGNPLPNGLGDSRLGIDQLKPDINKALMENQAKTAFKPVQPVSRSPYLQDTTIKV
ncbi:unnamed protein product [Owenia fusiformis]|uniref:Uncharacterized protein n=1 Tax=Owenia fusiformis TaxID=6347 RepID=A0A8J1XR32_OWEFU|nr:unnamed protein product [Owenia fusiformis]